MKKAIFKLRECLGISIEMECRVHFIRGWEERKIFGWIGGVVIHSSTSLMLLSWNGSSVGKGWKRAWMDVPLCLFWTIWRDRNWRALKDLEQTEQVLK